MAEIIKHTHLGENDVFVDLGSGIMFMFVRVCVHMCVILIFFSVCVCVRYVGVLIFMKLVHFGVGEILVLVSEYVLV